MPFAVQIVSAPHRPEVYAEIEYDGELVAEAYTSDGEAMVTFVDQAGEPMWEAPLAVVRSTLGKAESALRHG